MICIVHVIDICLLVNLLISEIGWKAEFLPMDHPLSEFEFDVIIGADGRRNSLEGMLYIVSKFN